ncbi:hypothetical protein AB7813_08370 [Tardiphaga sp. 20_F10_N6_6]|uniref:hypothetical protein n=1 Tax=Tardiphaga sp. 20_F10_N6_6 TaxID=3240788 RepID=UPI003F8AC547
MQELFKLKLTAAVVLGGLVHRAGALVEVVEATAKDLLRRGKAVLHEVEADLGMSESDDDSAPPAPAEPAPAPEVAAPAATTPPVVSPVDDDAATAAKSKAKAK